MCTACETYETRNACKILLGDTDGMQQLEWSGTGLEDNT
jgi:hypothetical protein